MIIREKKAVSHGLLMNMNDLQLLQLSWVFDLNFQLSFAMPKGNNYAEKLVSLLPRTDEILNVSDLLHDYVCQKAKAGYGSLAGDAK